MKQLISHLNVTLVDILSSQANSEGGVIPVFKVCELLLKVHDVLDMLCPNKLGTQLIF